MTKGRVVLEYEISGIMEGLALAHQWFELPVFIQTDCAEAITAMKWCTRKNRSAYGHLIDEIKHLLNIRDNVLMKIERDQNRIAHCLANIGRTGGSTNCWVRHIPVCISELVLADCNPIIEE
jgi:hypothetical protein